MTWESNSFCHKANRKNSINLRLQSSFFNEKLNCAGLYVLHIEWVANQLVTILKDTDDGYGKIIWTCLP